MKDSFSESSITTVIEKEKSIDLLPFEDNEKYSPIEKYIKTGKFPYHMIISIFLAIFGAVQILHLLNKLTDYSRQQERYFIKRILNDEDQEGEDYMRSITIKSISDLREYIKNSVSNYEKMKKESLDNIEYLNQKKALLSFNFLDKKSGTKMIINKPKHKKHLEYSDYFNITSNDLGPIDFLSNNEIRDLFRELNFFTIEYSLKTFINNFYHSYEQCFQWKLEQNFDLSQRTTIVVKLYVQRTTCINNLTILDKIYSKHIWIDFIVLILSLISIYLTSRYFSKVARFYMISKKKLKLLDNDYSRSEDSEYFNPLFKEDNSLANLQLDKNENDKDNMEILEQLAFIKKTKKNQSGKHVILTPEQQMLLEKGPGLNLGFNAICILGCLLQFVGSMIGIFSSFNEEKAFLIYEIAVGFGCSLAFLNLARYFEYSKNYDTVYATVTESLPNVLRYITGVFSIFIGFLLLGICLFWKSNKFFSNPQDSMMTLFALVLGDSIFNVFNDVGGITALLGYIYTYVFVILFISVVMNVFIVILEDAYNLVKLKNENHWLYYYAKSINYKTYKNQNHQYSSLKRREIKQKYQEVIF